MGSDGWIAIVGLSIPWALLIAIRAVRAFRDPDRWDSASQGGGVLGKRYVESQFERPRDERDLL
jgi:hypothetical protein